MIPFTLRFRVVELNASGSSPEDAHYEAVLTEDWLPTPSAPVSLAKSLSGMTEQKREVARYVVRVNPSDFRDMEIGQIFDLTSTPLSMRGVAGSTGGVTNSKAAYPR